MNIQERHRFKQSTIYSITLYIDPISIYLFLRTQIESKTSNGLNCELQYIKISFVPNQSVQNQIY